MTKEKTFTAKLKNCSRTNESISNDKIKKNNKLESETK